MTERIDVAMLPAEAPAIPADAWIVVDVLRATSTMAVLFARGVRELWVTETVEAARSRAASTGAVLFGEIGGLPPEGFDHGNSPAEAQRLELAGAAVVLFTTNGTRALCAVAGAGEVAAGALLNAEAVARWASGHRHVGVLCAGNAKGQLFSQEDFATAGVIVQALRRESPGAACGDAAVLAAKLAGERPKTLPLAHPRQGSGAVTHVELPSPAQTLVLTSEHAAVLKNLGLHEDVLFSAQMDTLSVVPLVAECGPGWARLAEANALR